jgi:hypothetical protein
MKVIHEVADALTSALAAWVLFLAAPTPGNCAVTITPAELTTQGKTVRSDTSLLSIPPHVARYLNGPVSDDQQFAFLIGDWDVKATKFSAGGAVLLQYKAIWSAKYLNEGRMVLDDFKALAPDGRPISSFVTLRTYCEQTRRWEMAGLAAMQPAASLEWYGAWAGNEMHINAAGVDPSGQQVKTRIRFSDITPDRFHWESESSFDGGKTWVRTASLVATRSIPN